MGQVLILWIFYIKYKILSCLAISKSVKQEVSCAVILPLQSKKVSSADSLIHLSTRNLIAQQNLFKNVHIATGKKGSLSLKCFSIIYRGVIYRLCCNVSSITSIVDAQQQHRRRRYDTLCFPYSQLLVRGQRVAVWLLGDGYPHSRTPRQDR